MSQQVRNPEHPVPPSAPPTSASAQPPPSRAGTIVVWSLIGCYVAVYTTFSLIKWHYFLYDDFDLAIYAQACHRAIRGSLYSPILNVNLLGNHMSLLMPPISIIYGVLPSPVTLLVLQTVVLALGALPVWWLARREIGNEFIAVCCAALYLLYPALGYANLYQFHPETLTTTTLLFAIYFLRTGRFWAMTIFAVLSLLAKEDVAIVIAGMGLYALTVKIPRRALYSATLVGLALASLFLSFGIIMPRVNKGEVQLERIYGHWGPTTGKAIVAMAKDPFRAATALVKTSPDYQGAESPDAAAARDRFADADTLLKRQYHLQMLMPVMFLALLSPLTLLIGFPAVAQHLLSQRSNDHTIVYHYTACVTPFVMTATVLGLRNVMRLVAKRRAATVGVLLAGTAVALAIVCQFLFGPVIGSGVLQMQGAAERHWPSPEARAMAPYMRAMLRRVPDDGAVVAGFRFLPHVIDRDIAYSAHHVYSGLHTMSAKPYSIPEDVVAMALDADSPLYLSFTQWDGSRRLQELIRMNRLFPVDSAGDALLLLRDAKEDAALVKMDDRAPAVSRRVDYHGQLALLGWDVPPASAAPGGRLILRSCWRRLSNASLMYLTQFAFLSEDRKTLVELPPRRIGYTIWPVHDWPSDVDVSETYRLMVPLDLPPGKWTLHMRVVDYNGRQLSVSKSNDEALRPTREYVPLGDVEIGLAK